MPAAKLRGHTLRTEKCVSRSTCLSGTKRFPGYATFCTKTVTDGVTKGTVRVAQSDREGRRHSPAPGSSWEALPRPPCPTPAWEPLWEELPPKHLQEKTMGFPITCQ